MCIHGPMCIHGRTYGPVYGIVPGDVREQSQFDFVTAEARVAREKGMPSHDPKICANAKKGASAAEMPAKVSLSNQAIDARGVASSGGELEAHRQSCEALADGSESFAFAGAMNEPYACFH